MKDQTGSSDHYNNPPSKKSLLKSIREKCLDCCSNSHAEVRKCHITDCPLWEFRMGKNPFHKRTMTEDQKTYLSNITRTQKNEINY
jgi:hypothetical protein